MYLSTFMYVYIHTEVKYTFVNDAIVVSRNICKYKKEREKTNVDICKYEYIYFEYIYICMYDVPEASSRPEGWISRAQNGTRR